MHTSTRPLPYGVGQIGSSWPLESGSMVSTHGFGPWGLKMLTLNPLVKIAGMFLDFLDVLKLVWSYIISSSSEDAASSKGEKSCKAEVTSSSSWCQEKAAGGFRSDLGLTIEELRNGNNSTMKACCPRVNYQINSLKETWVHSFFPWIPQVIKSATSIKYSRMVVFSYTWVQPCHITQNGKQLTKLMCWYLCSWEFAGLHKTSDAQQLNVQYWKHDGVTVLG